MQYTVWNAATGGQRARRVAATAPLTPVLQKNLPLEVGVADTKTISRLMSIMHKDKIVSEGINIDVPVIGKSRFGLGKARTVIVYTAYDCKVRQTPNPCHHACIELSHSRRWRLTWTLW